MPSKTMLTLLLSTQNTPTQVGEPDATSLRPVESMDGDDHENTAEDFDIWPPKADQYECLLLV